jgi:hypothetical protein
MPEAALAVFGGWVLTSLLAGSLLVTVRSWLKNRRGRTTVSPAQLRLLSRPPAERTRELGLVAGSKKRHAVAERGPESVSVTDRVR